MSYTGKACKYDKCVHELAVEQAKKTPDAIAVEFESQQLTYSELEQKSRDFADYLASFGIKPDEPVALYIDRCPEMVIAMLGILRAGGAYLPLDNIFPEERLTYMLEDANPALLVTLKKFENDIPETNAQIIFIDSFDKIKKTGITAQPLPENLAYILYTSGSTGKPKGVEIPHKALVNFLISMQEEPVINSDDILLSVTTISFDIIGLEIWLPLITGARVHLVTKETCIDGRLLKKAIEDSGATIMQATPATWRILLESDWQGKADLKILCGGEAWHENLAEKLLSRCSSLWNMYGPTETTIWSAVCRIYENEPVYIGYPIANTSFYVVDENLNQLPPGTAGELLIGGDGLARGYFNRPELTAEKFIPDTISNRKGARLYRTGDLVRCLQDGKIEFIGRTDHQVKIRGYRIELGEIESLLNNHDQIKQAVVTVFEEKGDKSITAYIIPEDGHHPSSNELRDYLKKDLPEYFLPSVFTIMNEFPLTPNGKVNRKSLPVPERRRQISPEKIIQAADEIEEKIASIWKELLNLDTISMDDNFFEIGGHSLLMVQMASGLEEIFRRKISVVDLFTYTTIRDLSRFIAGNGFKEVNNKVSKQAGSRDNMTNESIDNDDKYDGAIAIIGMSCRFPGASNTEQFWENLAAGKETIKHFTDEELAPYEYDFENIKNNPNYIRSKGILENIDLFDAEFFGFNPMEASLLDPQQRIWLEIAWEALESAGYINQKDNILTGVFAGSFINNYKLYSVLRTRSDIENFIRNRGQSYYLKLISNDSAYLPMRTSYKLDLKGPSVNVQTACSTSLTAIYMACQSLLNFESDICLAGGVCISVPQESGYIYQEEAIPSKDGHCRPFDKEAAGTVFSNGAGAVVLKRLDEAVADRDNILAVIKGTAINNDGSAKVSFTAPSVDGQVKVITEAQAVAEATAESISYIEAHGTATPIGDNIEIAALTKAFRENTQKKNYCGIGSVKSNIGHTDAAAGVASVIKTVLAIQHRQLPPTVHYKTPNPEIDFDNSPFYVVDSLKKWEPGMSLRAGVSSLGIGGTNVHVVLEEPPVINKSSSSQKSHRLMLVSAKSKPALEESMNNLKDFLSKENNLDPADVSFTLAMGRRYYSERAFAVCDVNDPAKVFTEHDISGYGMAAAVNNLSPVFMFPGQGSQYAGMGKTLYSLFPEFKNACDECFNCITGYLDNFKEVLFYADSDKSRLIYDNNIYAQLSLFTIEYAYAALWQTMGISPKALIGHSLGEWTAACVAEAISLKDAVHAVYHRGRLMESVSKGGSCISVRISSDKISDLLTGSIALAVVNNDANCVVSGPTEDIEKLVPKLKEQNIVYKDINVNLAVHSEMLDPVLDAFRDVLKEVKLSDPVIPVYSTVTGKLITPGQIQDPEHWIRNMRNTVRFQDACDSLFGTANILLLEAGPGNALSVLSRKAASRNKIASVCSSGKSPVTEYMSFLGAFGKLWANGIEPDIDLLFLGESPGRIPVPTYPFQRKRYWIDPLYSDDPITCSQEQSDINQAASDLKINADNKNNEGLPDYSGNNDVAAILKNELSRLSGLPAESIDEKRNFTDYGLDSLMLVEYASAVSDQFGIEIKFRSFYTLYRNIERLAFYCGSKSGLYQEKLLKNLVPLQTKGSRIPFFLVHGDRANSLLPPILGKEQPFYAFFHQGADGEKIRYFSVKEVADHYLEELLSVKPHGPYVLGGYSFGGVVAYEMTSRLIERGEKVLQLILIDSAYPVLSGGAVNWKEKKLTPKIILRKIFYGLPKRLIFSPAKKAICLTYIKFHRPIPVKLRPYYILDNYEKNYWKYIPEKMPVPVLFFKAKESEFLHSDERWEKVCDGGIEIYEIPGDHLSIINNINNFNVMAGILNDKITKINQNILI
ncbi:MAG: amino acid adenylation domain-containing protein [Spirochaetes bacterium]|nr:amino acid adenylation domain-containing protein [Spirochaetota bacterium]